MSRRCLFAVALCCGLVVAAAPAFAVDQRDFKNCDQSVDWDLKIAGCTKMLQVPKLPPEALSAIYAARGSGFAGKNDFARAIVDFNEALRLNPKSVAALNNRGAA